MTNTQKHNYLISVELRARVADAVDGGGINGFVFSTFDIDILDVNFFNFSISVGDKLNGDELV
jgi:hypothetical protein